MTMTFLLSNCTCRITLQITQGYIKTQGLMSYHQLSLLYIGKYSLLISSKIRNIRSEISASTMGMQLSFLGLFKFLSCLSCILACSPALNKRRLISYLDCTEVKNRNLYEVCLTFIFLSLIIIKP